jgi:chromosome segregation ATPase
MFIRNSMDYVYDIVCNSIESVNTVCTKTSKYVQYLLRDEHIVERINILENSLRDRNEISKQLLIYSTKIEEIEMDIRNKLISLDEKIEDLTNNFEEFNEKECKIQSDLKLLGKELTKNTVDIELLKGDISDKYNLNNNVQSRLDLFVNNQKDISETVKTMEDKHKKLVTKVNKLNTNYQGLKKNMDNMKIKKMLMV